MEGLHQPVGCQRNIATRNRVEFCILPLKVPALAYKGGTLRSEGEGKPKINPSASRYNYFSSTSGRPRCLMKGHEIMLTAFTKCNCHFRSTLLIFLAECLVLGSSCSQEVQSPAGSPSKDQVSTWAKADGGIDALCNK